MKEKLGAKWYSTYLKNIFDMFLNTDESGYVKMYSFYITVEIDEAPDRLWQISRPSSEIWHVTECTSIADSYKNIFDYDTKAYKHVLERIHEIKMESALE